MEPDAFLEMQYEDKHGSAFEPEPWELELEPWEREFDDFLDSHWDEIEPDYCD